MKILHIDWATFLDFLEPWEGLAPTARRFLLDSKPKEVLQKAAVGELPALLSGGFLRALSDGARVQLSEAFHESHKVLRSFARHPILQQPEELTLRMYLGDHFTTEERRGLSNSTDYRWDHDALVVQAVTSAGHVRGFLRTDDRRAWEKQRLARRAWSSEPGTQSGPLLASEKAAADLAWLLETLAAAKGPVPFRDLPRCNGSLPRGRLAGAIEAGLRYLLCFPAFEAGFKPVLTLWPAVAERLARVPPPPPPPVEPVESLTVAFRIEDLTQMLVRAAEPMRMKANGWSLFAAVGRELERGLLPLPPWLTNPELFPENAPGERVRSALRLAQTLGFLAESGEPGRDYGLVTAPAGWGWLDLAPRERLKTVLDLLRPEPERVRDRKESGEESRHGAERDEQLFAALEAEMDELEEIDALFGESSDDELVPFEPPSRLPEALSDAALFGPFSHPGLARAAIAAYATLEPGRTVGISDFLRHHAEASNPFLERGLERHGHALPEERLEELWTHGLRRIFHLYLLPLGGVSVGLTSAGALTIELNAVGRYVLGLADDFALDTEPPAKTPVRVQPDFEIVFVAASPALEAAISRFAERRGTGVGVLFRITRDSIFQAAQSGLGADEVLATLAGASTTPVPANVEHEIRAWFASCRRLRIEPVHLVRCPDAGTAARVLAAAGAGKLEALSETVLALTDPAHKPAVARACRKAGLFLTNGTPEPIRTRTRGSG